MTITVETRGAVLRVEDHGGARAGGPALLFLHYWGGTAATWRKVIAGLGDGVRCIAVNQRGWGGSTATDGRYDLQSMAEDVTTIIDRMKLRHVVLVGHSMGGKVAQLVAKTLPSEIAGLVLVAPAPPTAMPVPEEARHAMLQSYQSAEGVGQALGVLGGPTLTAEDRQGVMADTLAGEPGAKRAWTEQGMTTDLQIRRGDIAAPVAVLVGTLDNVERADRLRAIFGDLIPQASVIEVPGIGHLMPLEAPDAIVSACREMLVVAADR